MVRISLTFDVASGNAEVYAIAGNNTIAVLVQVNDNLIIDTSGGFGPDANASLPGGGRFSEVAATAINFTGTMNIASGVNVRTRGGGQASFATINGAGAGLTFNGKNTLNGNVTVTSDTDLPTGWGWAFGSSETTTSDESGSKSCVTDTTQPWEALASIGVSVGLVVAASRWPTASSLQREPAPGLIREVN